MTLEAWILETAMGNRPKSQLTVALFEKDKEVTAPGYRRLPTRWNLLTDNSADTTVTFGPYDAPVSYDRYVLFAGSERVQMIPEESMAAFPRGFTWIWNPKIVLGDPQ